MGLFGLGVNGTGGISTSCAGSTPGLGGSGGTTGTMGAAGHFLPANGGSYGGGGAMYGNGGNGAVRVIWGYNRSFPNTNVGQNYGGVVEAIY